MPSGRLYKITLHVECTVIPLSYSFPLIQFNKIVGDQTQQPTPWVLSVLSDFVVQYVYCCHKVLCLVIVGGFTAKNRWLILLLFTKESKDKLTAE